MTGRLARFGLVALVPTAVDVGLLLWLRHGLGWALVAANVVALAVASGLSYGLHRAVTFRSDPFLRWVHMPRAFVLVAVVAGAVDVAVLGGLHAVGEVDDLGGLALAKVVALAVAATVRVVLYRVVLLGVVRRTIADRPDDRPPPPGHLRATVVVPALDEAPRIGATVAALRGALAGLGPAGGSPGRGVPGEEPPGDVAAAVAEGVEVVVVDDGSTDGTADAALAAGADQVVVLPANRGKGAAVRAGLRAARGRAVAFTDADLSYSPDQVAQVIEVVEQGWDVVVGNRRHPATRTVRATTRVRDLGSRAINLLASLLLLSRPHDTQCGLKGFRADAAHLVADLGRIDGFAFDIEVLHLVERYELSCTDVPVQVANSDRSTVRAGRDGLRLLGDLWRIRHLSSTGAYELPAHPTPGLPEEPAAGTAEATLPRR